MPRESFIDLLAFLAVAKERSFTRQQRSSAFRSRPSIIPSVDLRNGSVSGY